MERVTPLRHLGDMETLMSVLLTLSAGVAGLVFIAAGIFSVLTSLWGDLLEPDYPEAPGGELTEAA